MDGKVLGFDAATGTGAIKGSDGSRHTFSLADWRGAAAPKAGDDVDFESAGGVAKEIYTTKGGGLNIDLGSIGAGAAGVSSSGVAQIFLASWGPILAALSLLFCLMTFAQFGPEDGNLFGMVDKASDLKDQLKMLGQFADDDSFGTLGLVLGLYPALFLIPISAIWVLVFAFMQKPLRLPTLVHGGLCVGLPVLLVLVAAASIPGEFKPMLDAAGGLDLGLGGWLLILTGIAQILATQGIIKATPAALINK